MKPAFSHDVNRQTEEGYDEVTCPLPLFATLVLAGLPIAQFGSAAQRAELLEPVCRGERVLSAAL